jgi:hypothetical protein
VKGTLATTMAPRMLMPIATAALYLASDEAAFITGVALDGGPTSDSRRPTIRLPLAVVLSRDATLR